MGEIKPIILIPQYKNGKLKKIEKRELVQCKDCKHWREHDGHCPYNSIFTHKDWYCADGVRKEGDAD